MRIAAGEEHIHAAEGIGAGIGIIAQKDAIVIECVFDPGNERIKLDGLKNGVHPELLQTGRDQQGGLFSGVILDVGIENKFNFISIGISQETVAIALFNSNFFQ